MTTRRRLRADARGRTCGWLYGFVYARRARRTIGRGAYLIDHDLNLTEQTLLFGAFKTYQRSVTAIEGLTDLDFGELYQFDGFSNEENTRGEAVRRLIGGPNDILV